MTEVEGKIGRDKHQINQEEELEHDTRVVSLTS